MNRWMVTFIGTAILGLIAGCISDSPTINRSCPAGEAGKIEIWRDRVIIHPRVPATEIMSKEIWQGVTTSMSRRDIESRLAPYLRSRRKEWSEFETPLGKLLWSLDREVSGGDEVQIPRMYLYPQRLTLDKIFSAHTIYCLRDLVPNAKYLVVMGDGVYGQKATIEIDGFVVKQIIWRQARS